ncbi:Adaptive-response sensory-kinase SasA [subsurface metagenome]
MIYGALELIEDERKTETELIEQSNTFPSRAVRPERVRGALPVSEEKWRFLLKNTADVILNLNRNGTILFINHTVPGYTIEDITGKTIYDFIPPEQHEKTRNTIEKVFQTGEAVGFETSIIRPDGGLLRYSTRLGPVKNGDKIVGVTQISTDITERKRAEDELRESEERFRAIFDNAADGILLADPESKRFHSGNRVMGQMLGCKPEEIKNLGVVDIHPEEGLPYVIEQFEKQSWGKFTLSRDIPVKRKDGSVFYADVNSVGIALRGKRYLMGIFRDVTERKKAEEALRDSESKYKTLVENLPQKIFLKDKNSVYVSCNDNLARDFKIKREEIAGKTDYDLVPKELADKYRADDKRIIESGETEAIEEKYIQQGEERIIHTVKTPVKDEQGNTIGVLGIFWDITELKRGEEELNLYREKMARAEQLASVGTLSATVAHELTQPLTVIRLSIENALAKLATTSSAATVMKNIEDSLNEVSNITSIVERFRNYARRSTKTIAGEVDLKAVAERTVQLLSESARQARVTLRLEGMDKLPPVYSSEKDVEQLFFALIENAVQAADGKKNRRLIIGGDVQDGHIELRFSDNCGGIAPENLDRIFEPFFTTKPAGEGTGLGLCVVQRIILEAGGKVRVESKAGKGTTFFITLPINKGKES